MIDIATRRVEIAGVTANPNEAFMLQCARQLTDPFEGFLNGKRYLIHDRDTKFTTQASTRSSLPSRDPAT